MVTTRGRQRKIGRRDSLWDLIVNNDDICFKHILPRLNGTDVKFLHGVNSETRKLIKRSSYNKGELQKEFKVREMSSISTLEVAWEHYPWGKLVRQYGPRRDEPYFCERVALTNKLELLKWAREDLLINFLVSLFTPCKNFTSLECNLGSTCLKLTSSHFTITSHKEDFGDGEESSKTLAHTSSSSKQPKKRFLFLPALVSLPSLPENGYISSTRKWGNFPS